MKHKTSKKGKKVNALFFTMAAIANKIENYLSSGNV